MVFRGDDERCPEEIVEELYFEALFRDAQDSDVLKISPKDWEKYDPRKPENETELEAMIGYWTTYMFVMVRGVSRLPF